MKRLQNSQAGFSLIEIMVVVIIVGIIVSVATLSIGMLDNDRDLTIEGDRFMALAEVAQDEAVMEAREFGVELMTAGYRFVEYDALGAQWAELPGDDTLRLRTLPDHLEFELYLEGRQILLNDDPAVFDDPDSRMGRSATDGYAPHLLIYSSGDTTPFELRILRADSDQEIVLRGDALGLIEIVNPDEA